MSRTLKPKEHPYDALRDSLKRADNSLFSVPMHTPTIHGTAVTGPWCGSSPISTWKISKMGFPGKRYARIAYDSGHFVCVPDESNEELQRLAQVFADILNSQFTN